MRTPAPSLLGSLPYQQSLAGRPNRRTATGAFRLSAVGRGSATATARSFVALPARDAVYEARFLWCRPTYPTMTRSFGSSQAKAMRIVWCGS